MRMSPSILRFLFTCWSFLPHVVTVTLTRKRVDALIGNRSAFSELIAEGNSFTRKNLSRSGEHVGKMQEGRGSHVQVGLLHSNTAAEKIGIPTMVHSKRRNRGYSETDPRYSEMGQTPESSESQSRSWLWGLLFLFFFAVLCAVFLCLMAAWLCRRPLGFAGNDKREEIAEAFNGPNKPPRPKAADALCETTRLSRDTADKSTPEKSSARPRASLAGNRMVRPPQTWEEAVLPAATKARSLRSSQSTPNLPKPPSQWLSPRNPEVSPVWQ